MLFRILTICAEGLARRSASGSANEPIFTREAVADRTTYVLSLLGVWFVCAVPAVLLTRREKTRPARSAALSGSMPSVKETRGKALLRLGLIGAAAALIILGVINGGLRDVFVKAINICTECIGLG